MTWPKHPKWKETKGSTFRQLLWLFGYRVEYVHEWGVWDHRYSDIDWHMCRPIHRRMSVAPPTSKRRFVKIETIALTPHPARHLP